MHSPIFVHSLFRSGSTYLFNCFRRTQAYTCYQEPEHEILANLDLYPDSILAITSQSLSRLRHPELDLPYFHEVYELRHQLRGLFKSDFGLKSFFIDGECLPSDQLKYFSTLIQYAKLTPMLQLCRSFGRISQLKKSFGGTHIHLWREPISQWHSYQADPYFESTIPVIMQNHHAPLIFNKLTQVVLAAPNENLKRYASFFGIWLYSHIQNSIHADIDISIDTLSSSTEYRFKTLNAFAHFGINHLGFEDCACPKVEESRDSLIELTKIESSIMRLFAEEMSNVGMLSEIDRKLKSVRS